MIKENELMLGNQLDKGSVGYIGWVEGVFMIGVFDDKFSSVCKFYKTEELNPIPLTEEILLKCGFKKSRNIGAYNTDKDAYYWEGDKISLTIDLKLSSSSREYAALSVDGAIPLKYVHQLQNLIFSVSGQELGINL